MAAFNAALNGLDHVDCMEGDLFAPVAGRTFDLIVSNPPYIPSDDIATLAPDVRDYDPRLALDGGPDGLSAYRAIVADAKRLLAPGGYLVLENTDSGGAGDFSFGLGNPDEVHLYLPNGVTEVDSYSYTDHALTTYGRCPNGTGAFVDTAASTKGGPNACPGGAGGAGGGAGGGGATGAGGAGGAGGPYRCASTP